MMDHYQHCLRDRSEGAQDTDDDHILAKLIHQGVIDHDNFNKCWDSSTRLMRYSVAVGDQLWSLLEKERAKVSKLEESQFVVD